MIKAMKINGCPIDGVGFQSHFETSMDSQDFYNGVRQNVKRYASINVEVHMSEVDIRCESKGGPHCVPGFTWNAENLKK